MVNLWEGQRNDQAVAELRELAGLQPVVLADAAGRVRAERWLQVVSEQI
ncbi:hypothetical protein [Saccharopolyspora sp. ASAGF58]|nr:hypothetical protein [Saccharopolyspora sp. ASAGF58]